MTAAHREACLRKLEELHALCSEIGPDSMSLFEALSTKEIAGNFEVAGERFAAACGSDAAALLATSLSRLATALWKAEGHLQCLLVAEQVIKSPEKFLP